MNILFYQFKTYTLNVLSKKIQITRKWRKLGRWLWMDLGARHLRKREHMEWWAVTVISNSDQKQGFIRKFGWLEHILKLACDRHTYKDFIETNTQKIIIQRGLTVPSGWGYVSSFIHPLQGWDRTATWLYRTGWLDNVLCHCVSNSLSTIEIWKHVAENWGL